jgi:hypothetical protein
MGEFKEFVVSMVVTSEHEYTVPARTAEEAAAIVQDLFDEGDDGDIVESTIESIDAVGCGATEYEEEDWSD